MSDKRERILAYEWALAMYYSQKNFSVSREVGLPYLDQKNHYWTKQRADFIAVNKRHEVIIVETKSCWSDFATDHKWQHYLSHCNKFYFGADTETAKRIAEFLKNVPEAKGVGVIAFEPDRFSFNMKFLVPARSHERQTPIEPILWQMAARSFDCPWNSEEKNERRKSGIQLQ